MKSGGSVDFAKAAVATFRKISNVKDLSEVPAVVSDTVNAASSAASGFVSNANAKFNKLTSLGGGIRAQLFGDRAPATSEIKGETPRVLAMASALAFPTPLAFSLLASVVKDLSNS